MAAYHVESIVYTRSYYDEKSEGGKIVLESGGKEYKLFPYLWQGQYDADGQMIGVEIQAGDMPRAEAEMLLS